MDEQLTYARGLQAAGYTLVQIRDLLLEHGIDDRTVYMVLDAIESTPAPTNPPLQVSQPAPAPQAATPIPQPQQPVEARPITSPAAYVNYVKTLLERGTSWADIDAGLATWGVNATDRSSIYKAVATEASTASSGPLPLGGPLHPETRDRQPVTPPTPEATAPAPAPVFDSAPTPPPTVQPQAPLSSHGGEEATDENIVEATNHLGQVVDHLSTVVEKLEAEVRHAADQSAAQSIAPPPPSADNSAERLVTVTDHLAEVVDKLDDDIKRPPPPPPASPNAPAVSYIPQQPMPDPPRQQWRAPDPKTTIVVDNEHEPKVDKAELESTDSSDKTASGPASIGEKRGMIALFACIALFCVLAVSSGERKTVWLSLLGLSIVGTVGFNLMVRKLQWTHINSWFTAAVLQTGLALPFLVKEAVRPIHFPHFSPFVYALLAVATGCLVSLQYCNVKALGHLEASVYSVVFNTRILLATAFGSLFLGETVGTWAMLGGLCIFAAVFIVRQKGVKAVTTRGVLFGLGAALSMSLMNTCEKELIKLVGYQQYIFPLFTVSALIMWSIALLHGPKVPLKLALQPQGVLLMVLRACAGIGFSYSLVFGPVAVSSYISSLSVVLLVVFGMLFLGERDYLRSKLAATGAAIAGLTLVLIDGL